MDEIISVVYPKMDAVSFQYEYIDLLVKLFLLENMTYFPY